MAKNRLITALDIGSLNVKGLIAEKRGADSYSILSVFKHPSLGFRKGVLVHPEDATKALRDLFLDIRRTNKEAAKHVFVNHQSEQVKCRVSRGMTAVARGDQEIQQEDVDRVLQASQAVKATPNAQVIHNIILEFLVDEVGDIQDPLGMNGNRLEVNTFVIETFGPQLNAVEKTLERVGFDVDGFVFNPLASSRSVTGKQQRDLGVLMIDIGFQTTSLIAYIENKVVCAKSIPIGSGHITNDLAIGLKTSVDVAEKLKLTYGCASARDVSRKDVIQLQDFDINHQADISRRFFCEIIEVRLIELFQVISAELRNAMPRGLQLPGGIVVTGGGAKMPGFIDLTRQEMKLAVQVGVPSMHQFEAVNPGHQEMFYDPEFAVAAGLILSGGDEEEKSFDIKETFSRFVKNLTP